MVADPNFAPMYATRTRKVKTDGAMPGPWRRHACSAPTTQPIGSRMPTDVRGRRAVRGALAHARTRYTSVIRALRPD